MSTLLQDVQTGLATVNAELKKDTVGSPRALGPMYGGGLWTEIGGDVLSMLAPNPSPLMEWIPARGVNTQNEIVKHLTWIAPKDFTGASSYGDFLATMDAIGECDFGTGGASFNVCEYSETLYRVPFRTETLKPKHFGMRYADNEPRQVVRGPNLGISIQTDAEWALSNLAFQKVQHMNWAQIHGDPAAGQKQWRGLDAVINTGYVASRKTGGGSCEFTDPQIVNGTALNTPELLLKNIEARINKVRMRASERGVMLGKSDIAIVMSPTHWEYLSDYLACGVLVRGCASTITLNNTVDSVMSESRRIKQGYMGFGFLPLRDGFEVPVICEPQMGTNFTTASGAPAVVGDIYFLTRSFGGVNILEHQFLNWNLLNYPRQANEFIAQGGQERAGWVTEANSCYYYYTDSEHRLISRMQPMQIKWTDVVVETALANTIESGDYTHQDFYAYNGGRGGAGTAYLSTIRS